MKITIDYTPAIKRRGGIGRYADELTRALLTLDDAEELGLFYTDTRGAVPAAPLDALPRQVLRLPNKLWRLSVLVSTYSRVSMRSLLGKSDIFHSTDHLLPPLNDTKCVFTFHDLSYVTHPDTHLTLNRSFLRLMMPLFTRRADAVICVSQNTREDIKRHYGVGEEKCHVIPLGVDARFRPEQDAARLREIRERYRLPERFILFVGTLEPRKNLSTLLEAFRSMRASGRTEKLVVVGRKGWRYQATLARLRQMGLEGEVSLLGAVIDEDLPAIYSSAACFCFPSLYEGFGLPPLEAMASGCPVVTSNTSSLPEVCGDAALLVSPMDAAALATALARVLDDGMLRDGLRSRGIARATRFTWRNAAMKTLQVYRSLLPSCS